MKSHNPTHALERLAKAIRATGGRLDSGFCYLPGRVADALGSLELCDLTSAIGRPLQVAGSSRFHAGRIFEYDAGREIDSPVRVMDRTRANLERLERLDPDAGHSGAAPGLAAALEVEGAKSRTLAALELPADLADAIGAQGLEVLAGALARPILAGAGTRYHAGRLFFPDPDTWTACAGISDSGRDAVLFGVGRTLDRLRLERERLEDLATELRAASQPETVSAYMGDACLLCEDCGEARRAELDAAGKAPADPADESSYDSSEYPKGPYSNGGGEADSPQHCDACAAFLHNPLTPDGIAYVLARVREVKPAAGESILQAADSDGFGLGLWIREYGEELAAALEAGQ